MDTAPAQQDPTYEATAARSARRSVRAAKVPEITVLFWVIKVLTTGMGEAASDFLGGISIPLAGAVGILGFAFAMWLQFRTRGYFAPAYWFAVAMVAVFGTMVADGLHVAAGIAYPVSTSFYALVLIVVLVLWWRSERTLSIHSITTRRREVYYWVTVLTTFALGTAAGDLTAASMNLGFLSSGVLFAALIAIPAIAWWKFHLNATVAFWTAYILTRPLGASFADWFGKPPSFGHGLGYGDGTVTAIALIAIIGLVAWATMRRSTAAEPGAVSA